MKIRPLSSGDAAQWQALRLQALHECPTAFSSSYEEEHDTPLDVVAQRLTPGDEHVVLGAFDGPRLVGIVGLRRERQRKLAHKALLWGMYVDPNARNRGTGRKLVAHLLTHAATMPGLRQITLGVNATNRAALALYETTGFKAFGVERGFLLVDGVLQDEIHMVHVLAATASPDYS